MSETRTKDEIRQSVAMMREWLRSDVAIISLPPSTITAYRDHLDTLEGLLDSPDHQGLVDNALSLMKAPRDD